jgi:hypothetical protein
MSDKGYEIPSSSRTGDNMILKKPFDKHAAAMAKVKQIIKDRKKQHNQLNQEIDELIDSKQILTGLIEKLKHLLFETDASEFAQIDSETGR